MVSVLRRLRAVALVLLVCAPFAAADAAVVASVDRSRIDLNESFTLKVVVDTAIDVEPDVSALEADFFIGPRTQLSNTTIVNGQITRSRTWSYVLMAKRAGNLVIPPIIIGSERSEPVPITVSPQAKAAPGEADIFVITEADFDESYVQAQILYTVKVYRAVATRQPRLSEPDITGVDVLVELAGEERSYDALLNGKSYNVVERLYALFPQESGEIRIAPARFEARVLRNGRISGRKVFQSEPIVVNVKPIPPPPDGYPDAAWLPAKSVTLSDEWSRDPETLPAGEPITRRLTVTSLGQLSTQIPVIEIDVSDSVKVYPDKPELRVSAEAGGILASRTDQYAMIGVETGDVVMPDVNLPWWDIAEGTWKIATLPGRTIRIVPSADALLPQVVRELAPSVAASDQATVVVHSQFWRRTTEIVAAVWVLTVLAWWWSGRPKERKVRQPQEPPIHKQQSRLLRDARKAAALGDSGTVKAALLKWARLQWQDDAPRSIGDLAERVTEPTASELRALCRNTYGPAATAWDGDALGKALRTMAPREEPQEASLVDMLPPLMPAGRAKP